MRKWKELSTGLCRESVPRGSQPLSVGPLAMGLGGSSHLAGPSKGRGALHILSCNIRGI